MNMKKIAMLGCGVVICVAFLFTGLVISWFVYLGMGVPGLTVEAAAPPRAAIGETVELEVTVKNERKNGSFVVSDVDLGGDYIKNFVVLSVEPPAKTSMEVPLFEDLSYTFNATVDAGETQPFRFQLQPLKTGIHRGEVEVYVGVRSASALVQTMVDEEITPPRAAGHDRPNDQSEH